MLRPGYKMKLSDKTKLELSLLLKVKWDSERKGFENAADSAVISVAG